MSGEKMDLTARSQLDALLAAASAPAPTDRELPGEAAALAAFRAARGAPPAPHGRRSVPRDVLTRVLTAKIATFGLVAVAGVGSVALATVAAPAPNGETRPAAPAPARTQSMRALPSATSAGTPATAPAAPLAVPSPPAGRQWPDRDAPGPAQLCRELGGMDDRQRGRALRDARYRDLVRDAGGSDRVGRFCDDRRRDRWQPPAGPSGHDDYSGSPGSRDSEENGYPGGRPSTPPSVSPAPKPPPRG
ncbi:hypothetical protein [Catenuloplanes indicus]|uniref:Uncharacterized protein n=1 Tax=Catenuloplanes indicus TaxID=137267 RepID=A0AAE3VYL8_9ACTN|nr:hypothetical protein [Catenuloplanes indicus]MDQ0366012.1 hypothetical protein [Catenuloplanes indicus]